MAKGVVSWSQTPATNSNADANINFAEGMAASQVNDSCRALMASVAMYRDDIAGSITTGGSSTAYTVTTSQGFTSTSEMNGKTIRVKFHTTNGAGATINVDGLGGASMTTDNVQTIASGVIKGGSIYDLTYNSSSGFFTIVAFKMLRSSNQVFTSSGTYTAPTGLVAAIVRCIGCGGGGGGVTSTAGASGAGGGGGAGGYAEISLTGDTIGSSQTITIGSGGAGGNATGGSSGGDASFGTLCKASGGTGGGVGGNDSRGGPGLGGTGITGSFLIAGSSGGVGAAGAIATFSSVSGYGGAPPLGAVTRPVASGATSVTSGFDGESKGSGGSGAAGRGTASTGIGGTGAAGLVMVTEFTFI